MKTNLSYYPHRTDAHRHAKFKMLRTMSPTIEQGWAAEGRFWALNNFIAEADNCLLDLSKPRNKGVVAYELGMSVVDFDIFLNLLKSDEIELIIEPEPNIFTTKKLGEAILFAYGVREKARERKTKQVRISDSHEKIESSCKLLESSSAPDNKGKERKEKENKLKEIKEKESIKPFFFFVESLFKSKTKLQNPSDKSIMPITKFFDEIPEGLSQKDIHECVTEAFNAIDKSRNVRVEFLCNAIARRISVRREQYVARSKISETQEAARDRQERKVNIGSKINNEITSLAEVIGKKFGEQI